MTIYLWFSKTKADAEASDNTKNTGYSVYISSDLEFFQANLETETPSFQTDCTKYNDYTLVTANEEDGELQVLIESDGYVEEGLVEECELNVSGTADILAKVKDFYVAKKPTAPVTKNSATATSKTSKTPNLKG